MGTTTLPVPVYWSDSTYAIVRWADVPDDVKGSWCATDPSAIVTKEYGARNGGPSSARGVDNFYRGRDLKYRYPTFWCKVRIDDMLAALQPAATLDNIEKSDLKSKIYWRSEDGQYVVMQCKDIPEGVWRGPNGTLTYVINHRGPSDTHYCQNRHAEFVKPTGHPTYGEYYAKVKFADVIAAAGDTPQITKPVEAPPSSPKLVDGISIKECLRRYTMNMDDAARLTHGGYKLTPSQKDAARAEWSRQLKEKQAEVARKEREQVVVDREFEDWE